MITYTYYDEYDDEVYEVQSAVKYHIAVDKGMEVVGALELGGKNYNPRGPRVFKYNGDYYKVSLDDLASLGASYIDGHQSQDHIEFWIEEMGVTPLSESSDEYKRAAALDEQADIGEKLLELAANLVSELKGRERESGSVFNGAYDYGMEIGRLSQRVLELDEIMGSL